MKNIEIERKRVILVCEFCGAVWCGEIDADGTYWGVCPNCSLDEENCTVLREGTLDFGFDELNRICGMWNFAVAERTARDWVMDIRAKQKGTRDNLIYKLNMLGWVQEEIADAVGLKQKQVSNVISNNGISAEITKKFGEGKSMEEIAEFYGLDLLTTWAMVLEGELEKSLPKASIDRCLDKHWEMANDNEHGIHIINGDVVITEWISNKDSLYRVLVNHFNRIAKLGHVSEPEVKNAD